MPLKEHPDDSGMHTIAFITDNQERIKICRSGNIYVNGRLADHDLEVVEALRNWGRENTLQVNGNVLWPS